jgi:hypothetical protein
MTLQNGVGTDTNFGSINIVCGGGIYNYGCTAMITDCIISSNEGGTWGGGIINHCSIATITGSTISSNNAIMGGGIYNTVGSTATITGSTISSNTAGFGGGIYNDGYMEGGSGLPCLGTVEVNNSIISSNIANGGGGIYNNGYLLVDGATKIELNKAIGDPSNLAYGYGNGYGGGILAGDYESGAVHFGGQAEVTSNYAKYPDTDTETSWDQGWGVYRFAGSIIYDPSSWNPAIQVHDNFKL